MKLLMTTGLAASLISGTILADNHVLSLDAVGEYVIVPHHASQNTASGGLTVEFWMLMSGGGQNARGVTKSGPSDCEWGLNPQGFPIWGRCGPATDVFGDVLPMHQWVHVAGNFDALSNTAELFVDGILVGSSTGTGATQITNYPILMGMQPGFSNSQLFGKIDNVRVWNYARTDQQIQQSASLQITAADASNYPGLIGSWSFEDGANDATGVNHGTLMGGAEIIVDNFLPTPCPGDVDDSTSVDGVDLAILLQNWGEPSPKYPRADINGDSVVNGSDLAIVLDGWGACP